MLDNSNGKCPFTDEIVSYMYDEIGGAEAGVFESHLADCTMCTDEFAAISNARFSVYEWHKEEFAPLPTPQFVIPYDVKPTAESLPGIFAGFRELFAFNNWPVTVAAALAMAIAVGFLAMSYVDNGEQQIASNSIQNVRPESPSAPQDVEPEQIVSTNADDKSGVLNPESAGITRPADRRAKHNRAVQPQKAYAVKPQKKAPVLSPFDDDADTTLRLADLFDGIGS